jgi:hypothetical protein
LENAYDVVQAETGSLEGVGILNADQAIDE